MESIGAFPEGDWESFSRMFSYEDLEFTPHFLGQYLFSNSHNTNIEGILNYSQSSSFNCPISEANTSESPFHTLDSLNSNLQYLSQESSYSSTSTTQENYNYFSESCHIPNIDISVPIFPLDHEKNNLNNGPYNNIPAFSDNNATMGETLSNVKEDSGDRLKTMPDVTELDETNTASPPNPKKRARVSRHAQKSKKNVESSKKNQTKMTRNGKEDEPNNTGISGHSTSSYSSEEDNASQENNGGANSETILNLNGKARASRGSATDPQSLYARKRRERINERLRILQNLVPNGTKVDLSTMLEEAVHYVKFLQLQIKLLSSDDLWMYAPLAYNGMDIGLNEKLSQLV